MTKFLLQAVLMSIMFLCVADYPVTAQNSCATSPTVLLPLNWPVDPNKLKDWITPRRQEGHLLCWAATTEMAVNFFGRKLPQCEQANDAFFTGRNRCCPDSAMSDCDNTNSSLPQFKRYGFHVSTGFIAQWDELKTFVCEKQNPFLYFYLPTANDREHILLVWGYDTDVQRVYIVDPDGNRDETPGDDPALRGPLTEAYTFDEMFGDFGPMVHTRDFIEICPEATAAANRGSCPRVQE